MKILERIDFNDSIIYKIEKQHYGNIDTLNPPFHIFLDTIFWQVSASSVKQTQVLHNTITSYLYEEEPFNEYGLNWLGLHTSMSFPLDGNNRISMHYNFTNAAMLKGTLQLDSTDLYLYDTVAHCPFFNSENIIGNLLFEEGKGITSIEKNYSIFQNNNSKSVIMVGSIINNDSMGIVLPDGIQNDSLNPTPPVEFALLTFPNPIKSNQIQLAFNKTIDSPASINGGQLNGPANFDTDDSCQQRLN
jgi:hypothetical protein